jgi:O-antigen ligase/tetratricopeptide (TPR) repeat protein
MLDRVAMAGLLIVLVAVPMLYDRAARDPFTTPKRAASTVSACALAALALTSAMRGGIRLNRAFLCLAAVVAAGVCSAATAASWSQAIENLRELLLLAVPAAVAGCALLRSPRRVLWCANALGAAAFLVAVVGILQHQRLDWWGYRESAEAARGDGPVPSPDILAVPVLGEIAAAAYRGLDALARPGAFAWAGPAQRALEEVFASRPFARLPTQDGPASVFGHPNVAAEVVGAGLVALAVAARAAWKSSRLRGRTLVAIGGLAVRVLAISAMAYYLGATGTRGAWVALAASATVLAAAYVVRAPRGRRLERLAIMIACAVAAASTGFFAGSRISVVGRGGGATETPIERIGALFEARAPERDTILERRILWANTHEMLDPSPRGDLTRALLGVGPGNWQVVYPLVSRRVMEHPVGTYTLQRYPDHPHQDGLEFLAEYGLLGAAALACFLGAAIARLLGHARRAPGETGRASLALLGILTAILTVSLFSFPLHMPVPLFVTFLAAGAALAVGGGVPARPGEEAWTLAAGSPAARIAASGILFAAVAALGGSRAGAALAAAVAAVAATVATRPTARAAIAIAAAVAIGAGLAAFPALRSGLGTYDAAVVLVALAVVAVAAAPLDAPVVAGGRASKALAAAAILALVVAALSARARVAASEDLQTAMDYAWGARFIPAERGAAELRARAAYDRATASNPSDFLAEASRTAFLNRSGFLADAEASARRVLRLHPWLVNPHVELASLALKQGRDEASMKDARAARALNPDTVEPHWLIGELFLRQGRGDLAAAAFERAIEASPGRFQPYVKIRAAEAYLGIKDAPRALRSLDEAERESAADAPLLARIASLYSLPGNPPELQAKGDRLWKRVAALDPADEQARFRVTIAPLLTGEPSREQLETILAAMDDWIRERPDFDPTHVRAFRALALERLGRREEALRAYRELTLLTAIGPSRRRADDQELDAAIEALRALQAESRPDSSPTRPHGR